MKVKNCGIIGQEIEKFGFAYNEEECQCLRIKFTLLQQICVLITKGVTNFYCDCRIGVGMWVSEILIGLMDIYPQISINSVISHKDEAVKWSEFHRDRYYNILEKATNIHIISTHYNEMCVHQSNLYIVNNIQVLLSCFQNDGCPHCILIVMPENYYKQKNPPSE